MSTAARETVCANPDCRIAETGKCVEGLSLTECPHYGRPESSEARERSTESLRVDIGLPSGDRLTISGAEDLLRVGETRVVALIGASEAGKTSLIGALYDLMQLQPAGPIRFAGSRSLRALEQACHLARAESEGEEPDTERTLRGAGLGFFDLALFDETANSVFRLLLSDRAGEEYVDASDDPAAAAAFVETRRADVLTVLVDGQRLVDVSARHNLKSEIELILQGLVDGDALFGTQRLAIILTKLDLVSASPDKNRAENDFELIVQRLKELFGTHFAHVATFRVAASPTRPPLARGHGVRELLAYWALPVLRHLTPQTTQQSARMVGRLRIGEMVETW